MILFLARCAIERLPRGRIARRERLALIKRLRADFADVVDAHQRRGVRTLFVADRIFGHALGRRRPARLRHAGHRAQRAVELANQTVEGNHAGGQKFIQPVMMYLCSLGETTPTCVWVKSDGQIKVRPFFASKVCFWYTKCVPPPSLTSFR